VSHLQTTRYSKREHIWHKVREKQRFSVTSLQAKLPSNISKDCVRDYLMRLCAAGYMQRNKGVSPIMYTLIKDCGVSAPRLRTDGTVVRLGEANENMWRSAKILKSFDWHTLMLTACTETVQISPKTARAYVEALAKAGYLFCIRPSVPGTRAIYRLNPRMNTGARPPKIRRDKSLYDQNLNKVVSTKGQNNEPNN